VPLPHLLLALAVVAVWGSNFVVIRIGLDALPPLLFATLRFALVALPLTLFLPRPKVPWRNLAAYGIAIGAGQFGLLFLAMRADVSPGLASLIVQAQVFFTIGLAAWFAREPVRLHTVAALALAVGGLVLIGVNAGGEATPLGIVLVLCAGLSWAIGNTVQKAAGRVDVLAYVVWSSLFAVPPLALAALIVEGPQAIAAGLSAGTATTWLAVAWQSVGNSMFGYGAWGWLLARYPATSVAPMALLVPVFGIASSALALGEPLQLWKLTGALLVLGGLALNLLWPRLVPQR
jgi:O-acetylserine/cysteine efflux transporter